MSSTGTSVADLGSRGGTGVPVALVMVHHAGGSCGSGEGVLESHKGSRQRLAFSLALRSNTSC